MTSDTQTQTPTTLILGIGNVLMTDEAVGPEVIRRLAPETTDDPSVICVDGGTLSFTLAVPIGDCQQLIVVDASALGGAPGCIRVFEDEEMDSQLRSHAKTVHEVSLADLMDMARLTDTLPKRRALIGIEPGFIGWGERLTPDVDAAIPAAIERIRDLLDRWNTDATLAD